MKQPILVVMAAGMGSRFGGLKQMTPVGKSGEAILEFSLYDAVKAGFRKVVFIIKKEIEADFKAAVGEKVAGILQTEYAFQETDKLPEGYSVPEGRKKPWGTGHAVLCAKPFIDQPFAVINADDYYGRDAFQVIYNALAKQQDDEKYRFCMVAYQIENTLTENGHVARGVCHMNGKYLDTVQERTHIQRRNGAIRFTEDDGASWETIPEGTPVSMNLWGFSPAFLDELEAGFPAFLDKALAENPLKGEYFLPGRVNDLLKENRATVEVLRSSAKWYGVTYREDLEGVAAALQGMQEDGIYPEKLFS